MNDNDTDTEFAALVVAGMIGWFLAYMWFSWWAWTVMPESWRSFPMCITLVAFSLLPFPVLAAASLLAKRRSGDGQ